MRFGYARVSSKKQSLDIQIDDLNAHACERIMQEKVSGRSIDNRPELAALLNFVRKGDEIWITRIDRLARSTLDLCQIVAELEKRGVTLHCTKQPIETKTPMGRLFVQLLAIFAEFENEVRRERQLAGIEAYNEKIKSGEIVQKKRKPTFDPAEIKRLYHHNVKPSEIAKRLGASAQTVYRVLELNTKGQQAAVVQASSVSNIGG